MTGKRRGEGGGARGVHFSSKSGHVVEIIVVVVVVVVGSHQGLHLSNPWMVVPMRLEFDIGTMTSL